MLIIVCFTIGLLTLFLRWVGNSITLLDLSQLFFNFASVLAIAIGGAWALSIFIQNRERILRADLKQKASHYYFPGNKVLVRVELLLENRGKVLLPVREMEVRIQQILPLHGDVETAFNADRNPKVDEDTEFPWETIAFQNNKFPEGHIFIEPGESQEFVYDFLVEDDIDLISVYSYVYVHRSKNPLLSWDKTLTYSVGRDDMAVAKKKAAKKKVAKKTLKKAAKKKRPPKPIRKKR